MTIRAEKPTLSREFDMVEPSHGFREALREHSRVCAELLALAQREAEALQSPKPFPMAEMREQRQGLLTQLEASGKALAAQRQAWQKAHPPGTPLGAELQREVDAVQNTIMRLLVLDRENEQHLLRRGLLPARSLPPSEQARPNYIFDTYHRHLAS